MAFISQQHIDISSQLLSPPLKHGCFECFPLPSSGTNASAIFSFLVSYFSYSFQRQIEYLQKHLMTDCKNESLFPPLQCLLKHPLLNSTSIAHSFLASLCTQKTISYNIIVKGPVSALTFMDRV
jgi:hypothetical protein